MQLNSMVIIRHKFKYLHKNMEDEWLFSVSDNGIGIDTNIKNRFLTFSNDYTHEKNTKEQV